MDRALLPPPSFRPRRRSPVLAAILGWLVPGLGQLFVGRPRKALLYLAAILPLFAVGWWLTDLTVVNPSRHPLDFVAQAFLGGPTAAALHLGGERALTSLPRWFDVGRLYVQVAGLLNLVAVCDAVGEAIAIGRIPAPLPAPVSGDPEDVLEDVVPLGLEEERP